MKLYKKNPTMTVVEAGKIGGDKTKATRGHEHYVAAGRKGGATNVALGTDFAALGHLGGTKLYKQQGPQYYAEIGRKGGNTNKLKGRAYFQEIGRKGGKTPRKLHKSGNGDKPITLEN